MEFFDFIKEHELAELPLDDPERAFVSFVRLADRRLQDRLDRIEESEDSAA